MCFATAAVTPKDTDFQRITEVLFEVFWVYVWKICRVCSFLWSTVIMQCLCESELQCECGFSNDKWMKIGPLNFRFKQPFSPSVSVWKHRMWCIETCVMCCVYDIFSSVFVLIFRGFEILALYISDVWCTINWIMFGGELSNVHCHVSVIFS